MLASTKTSTRVYEAGAAFWEEPIPTEAFVKFLSEANLRRGLNAIDMGCGEGRDSVFLAKSGFNVTSVDASPSAIKRAKELAEKETVHMGFLVADISNLPIRSDTYDLAINIACLHVITCQHARNNHLREARSVLKQESVYFSCNLGADEPMSVEGFYEKSGTKPGELMPRKIKTGKGENTRLHRVNSVTVKRVNSSTLLPPKKTDNELFKKWSVLTAR